MRVALSHDWLNGMRGGEKCLESLIRLYPDSRIYTLLHEKNKLSGLIESRPIETSFLQKLPWGIQRYKVYLPIFPMAARSLKVKDCDLMISTNHCVAKGIRKPRPTTPHICYCFTPMRYAWLFFDEYFGSQPAWVKAVLNGILGKLRNWDLENSKDVTHFIAISEHIKKRIRRFYGREAAVIYPPVDTDFFVPSADIRGDFYLIVSALVPYKRVDLAIRAFNELGLKLVVIGNGPERKRLEKIAGPTIEFLGWTSDEEIRRTYRTCKALIFPGEEDFGIVPVEAQACGAPVVAFREGGALETVIQGETGVFFDEQSALSLKQAVIEARTIRWDSALIRKNAERFGEDRFRREFKEFLDNVMVNRKPQTADLSPQS